MPKKNASSPPKQSTAAMSPSHSHIVGAVANPLSSDADADEEDGYVCPICESECTCRNKEVISNTNARVAAESLPSSLSNYNTAPTLKIKLTVPPSMRLSSSSIHPISGRSVGPVNSHNGSKDSTVTSPLPTQVAGPSNDVPSYLNILDPSLPKRRGRPPKAVVAARQAARAAVATAQLQEVGSTSVDAHVRTGGKPNTKKNGPGQPVNARTKAYKGKNTTGTASRKAAASRSTKKKKAPLAASITDDATDIDEDTMHAPLPTFLAASVISSSMESSSDGDSDSDLSSHLDKGFETDSSIEAEEENFIIRDSHRAHDKARVKRELLGDEPNGARRRYGNGNWEIRSRKRSVGPSDGEVVANDSDASDSDDEEEDEEEEADVEDDADEGAKDGDRETEQSGFRVGTGYAGVATGWSDSEESTFDADLFFTNLSSDSEEANVVSDADDTDSEMDVDGMSPTEIAAAGLHSMFGGPDMFRLHGDLALDAGEAWNGKDGDGSLGGAWGWDFGLASVSGGESGEPDQEMLEQENNEGYALERDEGSEEEEEEEEGGAGIELRESDGETTEEELVGEDGLPTQRAMLLFRWPTPPPSSIRLSAIDPRQTVSPERGQRFSPFASSSRRSHLPKPGDILAGQGNMFWDGEEEEEMEGARGRMGSVSVSSDSRTPVMGHFEPKTEDRKKKLKAVAIIDGKNDVVPSPYKRRRKRVDSGGVFAGSPTQPGFMHSAFRPVEEFFTDSSLPTNARLQSTEPIDLSDVLDDSFLNSDRCMQDPEASLSSAASEDDNSESRTRHLRNLSRWERIPMGTFRQTRETAVGNAMASSDIEQMSSRGDGLYAYPGARRNNSLSTSVWPLSGARDVDSHARRNVKSMSSPSKSDMDVTISPVILPVRDGDRTPTQTHAQLHHLEPQHHVTQQQHNKSRKEQRKEKKLKRKTLANKGYSSPPQQNHNQQHKYRHHRQHHPNQKTRVSGSMQRTNFFGSPGSSVPPLNI